MAAKTGTYTLIGSTTLSTSATNVTFSSIPATYTDLILVMKPIKGTLNYPYIRFNSDSGSNYSITTLGGNGTTVASTRSTNITQGYLNETVATTTTGSTQFIVNINDYSNATTYKTYLVRGGDAGSGTDAVVGLWRSTAAINTVACLGGNGGTFDTGTNIKLYGIEAAK
jgi:hypothetical protein